MIQVWTGGFVVEQVGAWAAVIKTDATQSIAGVEEGATSSRMELFAICMSLRATPVGSELQVFSNSTYVVNALEKGWVYKWRQRGWLDSDGLAVIDTDLWAEIVALMQCRLVSAVWVKCRSVCPTSEQAALIAQKAAMAYMNSPEHVRKGTPGQELIKWQLGAKPPLASTPNCPDFKAQEYYIVTVESTRGARKPFVRVMPYHWRCSNGRPPEGRWLNLPKSHSIKAWAYLPRPYTNDRQAEYEDQ
ncbi:MAG: hypothetical protein EA367_19600 [Leptolyngbya sp. DLM2.Bin15]|nr:MAG: hypothetical protein EA367_19600 [Leptolyngbya sp. DLM2.Bin15]